MVNKDVYSEYTLHDKLIYTPHTHLTDFMKSNRICEISASPAEHKRKHDTSRSALTALPGINYLGTAPRFSASGSIVYQR